MILTSRFRKWWSVQSRIVYYVLGLSTAGTPWRGLPFIRWCQSQGVVTIADSRQR
jgi:hypothetical protein